MWVNAVYRSPRSPSQIPKRGVGEEVELTLGANISVTTLAAAHTTRA